MKKKMDESVILTVALMALVFIPVIIAILLPIVTSAGAEEAIVIETTRNTPVEAPKPQAPNEPRPEPATTKSPTPVDFYPTEKPTKMPMPTIEQAEPVHVGRQDVTPLPSPDQDDLFDNRLVSDQLHSTPIEAGNARYITISYVCDEPEGVTLELIPELIVSTIGADDTEVNDDWVYCPGDEWEEIKLEYGETHEFKFEILPPEGTPKGEYFFTYTVKITPSDISKQSPENIIRRTIEFNIDIF